METTKTPRWKYAVYCLLGFAVWLILLWLIIYFMLWVSEYVIG
ncbi:hypothetical protein ACI6PS_03525 [Flavobacterium sp. PLA-1-15]